MKVRVYATLRPIVGGATVDLATGPGDTFRDIIDELITRWPDMKAELYDRNGIMRNNIHVFLNGREILRSNMPGGTIDFQTPALSGAPDDGKTFSSHGRDL